MIDLVLLSMSLIVIALLVLWIKNAKKYIERNNRTTYNTLMYILCIYSSTSLIAFSFGIIKLPFYKEIFIVSALSIWAYIIISLINKEYRNALWGVIYKII